MDFEDLYGSIYPRVLAYARSVRMLMQMGRATVVGRERHAGAPTCVLQP